MELSEKIQKLRKEHGFTQEQFAQKLFVSRTAVSKWETGRGTPSMESLRMIAKVCSITLDELLCAEEVVLAAENENRVNIDRFASRMDAMFNITAILGMFLPLYKMELEDQFFSVPLYQFTGWLAFFYWLIPAAMALCGLVQMGINRSERERLRKCIHGTGIALNTAAVFVLILSSQPYGAVFFFALLLIRMVVMLTKHQ